ncbi:MAG: XRE family transcriptional regulator [Pseudomonadota bacterium]
MKAPKTTPVRPVKARNGRDLARLLELSEEDSAAIELRVALLKKIISEVSRQELTHAKAAELTGTSRSRMTSILNGAIQDVSTDLLLRVLAALGIRARISFARAA